MSRKKPRIDSEPDSNWILSPYEQQRQAHALLPDATPIAVNPRSMRDQLTCPICLDLFQTTMTTKDCLHRFCKFCINRALATGNKECPSCRKKLVSKRSLRPDVTFDLLIENLFPNCEDIDEEPIPKKKVNEKSVASQTEIIPNAEPNNKPKNLQKQTEQTDLIDVVLKPISADKSGKERYIQCPLMTSMSHLAKFLHGHCEAERKASASTVPTNPARHSFAMYRATGHGRYDPLPDTMMLKEFMEQTALGKGGSLELYYLCLPQAGHISKEEFLSFRKNRLF